VAYARQQTWLPTQPQGLGQAATCPSLEQLMGIVDPTDPCQSGTASSAYNCYNTTTGAVTACPVSGTAVGGTPASAGPFGTMTVGNLNWGVLAAVLVGLVVVAGMSGGK